MARGFGATLGVGSTDKVVTTTTSYAAQRSYFAYFNCNGGGGLNVGRILDQATSGMLIFENTGANVYAFQKSFSTTAGQWTWARPSNSAWHTIGLKYDDGATTNDPTVYSDGSKIQVGSGLTEASTPSGTATDLSGNAVYIGNRVGDDRNWNGQIAECAIWHALLDDAEFGALAHGFSPLLIRPNSLVMYVPLVRDNVAVKSAAPTITGTAVQPHPRIIKPSRPRITTKTVAVGGLSIPIAAYHYNHHLGTMAG